MSLEESVTPSGENWEDPDENCMLCHMDQRTHWYYEDERIVIADALNGHPFVVMKRHDESCPDELIEHAHEVAKEVFGEHEFDTRMHAIPDHFHTHIVDPDEVPKHLKNE